MLIVKTVETIVYEQQIVGSLCNKCGNVFGPHDETIKPSNANLGEYGNSKYEICDECHLKFIKSFLIVPTGFMSSPFFTSSFDLDHELHQRLFDEWRQTGVWNWDEDPWRDYYSDNEEVSDAIEVRKPCYVWEIIY